MNQKVIGVIPARYSSTRLPGKPLVKIAGVPMIQRVWERCLESKILSSLIVATDDERIGEFVESFGGRFRMTSPNHASGTDRIAEAVRGTQHDIVVNIQGDEPLITGEVIDSALSPLLNDQDCVMSSCMKKMTDPLQAGNPNIVKVITDIGRNAIYFSRYPVPFVRDPLDQVEWYKHIGIYCYRMDFLQQFCTLEQPMLEKTEKLEQLRAIYHGFNIRMVETDYESVGVDTPEDVLRVEAILRSV